MNVLFDLDGTLTDPKEGFLGSINYALKKLHRPALSGEEIQHHIGPPLEKTLQTLLGSQDSQLIGDAVTFYRERYGTTGIYENTLYPGVVETLANLQDQRVTLFLATSKPQVFAQRIVQHFRLSPFFQAIHGSGLDSSRSRKGQLIAYILQTETLSPKETLMVGDRWHDIVGALENEITPIGVLWGYGSRAELVTAGAVRLCEHPSLLTHVIGSLCQT